MDSVQVAYNHVKTLESLRSALGVGDRWHIEETPRGDLFVQSGGEHVFIILSNGDVELQGETVFVLQHSGIDLVKQILPLIADDPNVIIDNEFDTVLPGNEFVSRIRNNPDWDWRAEFLAKRDKS